MFFSILSSRQLFFAISSSAGRRGKPSRGLTEVDMQPQHSAAAISPSDGGSVRAGVWWPRGDADADGRRPCPWMLSIAAREKNGRAGGREARKSRCVDEASRRWPRVSVLTIDIRSDG